MIGRTDLTHEALPGKRETFKEKRNLVIAINMLWQSNCNESEIKGPKRSTALDKSLQVE